MPTDIAWAEESWNPVTGCTRVSEGCQNCYAEAMTRRFWKSWKCEPPPNHFKVKFHPDRLDIPLRWKKPRRVFVCSMSDWMLATRMQIDSMLEVMAACPQHTFITLTKRARDLESKLYAVTELSPIRALGGGDYLPNLWLGVTVENDRHYDRIEKLLQIPAAVRFVSIEPMLSTICIPRSALCTLSWVILGCESGASKRPCKLQWMVNVVEQCAAAGVPVFVKQIPLPNDDYAAEDLRQMDVKVLDRMSDLHGWRISHDMNEWPEVLRVQEYPEGT